MAVREIFLNAYWIMSLPVLNPCSGSSLPLTVKSTFLKWPTRPCGMWPPLSIWLCLPPPSATPAPLAAPLSPAVPSAQTLCLDLLPLSSHQLTPAHPSWLWHYFLAEDFLTLSKLGFLREPLTEYAAPCVLRQLSVQCPPASPLGWRPHESSTMSVFLWYSQPVSSK